MEQVKWFERQFDLTSSQKVFPSIVERLAGTPAHLDEKFASIPPEITTTRINGTWTIKENVGHLIDLEPLWQGRLEDILAGKTELRPADLLNTKTTEGNHNNVPIDVLLNDFRHIRKSTLTSLEKLSSEEIFMSALHPRLKTPMRVTDLFLFVAEHDDHHLARITELVKLIRR